MTAWDKHGARLFAAALVCSGLVAIEHRDYHGLLLLVIWWEVTRSREPS